MKSYPLFLNLEGKHCLVFGGGEVAARKISSLLSRGARVTCVSKDFCGPLKRLARRQEKRRFDRRGNPPRLPLGQARGPAPTLHLKQIRGNRISLNGARLVIAATSDRPFNERIARECRRKKIWVNVVDDPELCDFTVPAVLERGPLQVAVSTGGTSPLFARKLREELEKVIPVSTGRLLENLGKIRRGAIHGAQKSKGRGTSSSAIRGTGGAGAAHVCECGKAAKPRKSRPYNQKWQA